MSLSRSPIPGIGSCEGRERAPVASGGSLALFNEVFDPTSISFRVSVAGQRISSAGGLDQYIRPDKPGLNMNRGDFGQVDRYLIDAEPVPFPPRHGPFIDLDNRRENEVAFRPTA